MRTAGQRHSSRQGDEQWLRINHPSHLHSAPSKVSPRFLQRGPRRFEVRPHTRPVTDVTRLRELFDPPGRLRSRSMVIEQIETGVYVFAGLLLTAGSLGDRYGRQLALNSGLVTFRTARSEERRV